MKAVRCVILTNVKRTSVVCGEEGGGHREGKRSYITVSQPLTGDLAPAVTSYQTLFATETNVALCSMSFPHYGSNDPDIAPASVSLSV